MENKVYLCYSCGRWDSIYPNPVENGLTFYWERHGKHTPVKWDEDGKPICACGESMERVEIETHKGE